MSEGAVKSADRVLALLERLGETSSEMSHSDLAEALDIPKSSLTELLKTLTARQWLSYSGDSKTYALGPTVLGLARGVELAGNLAEAAPPILGRLTEATGESSALNMRKAAETEVVATVLSPQRLMTMMRLGDRAPLYATSSGKVILAFSTAEFLSVYLRKTQFRCITAHTLSSPADLQAELKQVRAKRFAASIQEFTPGIVGLACPLLDRAGKILAAVSIAMPASRDAPDRRREMVGHIERAVAEFQSGLR